MDFGKRTVQESYFDGKLKSTKTEYSVPEIIKDKTHALSVIMKCMELIDSKETTNMQIEIKADPKTHKIRLITKTYTITH